MYKDKGILTDEELTLVSRYPVEIQDRLKSEVLKAKEITVSSLSYDRWIKNMEQGMLITFNDNVTCIGEPNIFRLARTILEMNDGKTRKPLKEEIEHDGRLEAFKQYPKGTRIKANGEVRIEN